MNKAAGLSTNNSNNVGQSHLTVSSAGNMNRLIPGVPALGGMPPLSQTQPLSQALKHQSPVMSSTVAPMHLPSPLVQQQAPTALMTVQPTSSTAQQLQPSLSTIPSEQITHSTTVSNAATLNSSINNNKPLSSSGISPAVEQAFMQYLQVYFLSKDTKIYRQLLEAACT